MNQSVQGWPSSTKLGYGRRWCYHDWMAAHPALDGPDVFNPVIN